MCTITYSHEVRALYISCAWCCEFTLLPTKNICVIWTYGMLSICRELFLILFSDIIPDLNPFFLVFFKMIYHVCLRVPDFRCNRVTMETGIVEVLSVFLIVGER